MKRVHAYAHQSVSANGEYKVSHASFLRVGVSHCMFQGAGYRIFDFPPDSSDELVEHALTRGAQARD